MELKDRAIVLMGLFYFAGILTDDWVRRGLSIERFAQILADIIVNGIGGGEDPPRTATEEEADPSPGIGPVE
jgi:hypothetical protein